jgi:hypothetical protein
MQFTTVIMDQFSNKLVPAFASQEKGLGLKNQKKSFFAFQSEINQLAASFFQVETQKSTPNESRKVPKIQVRILARILVFPIFLVLFVILEIAERLRLVNHKENNKSNSTKSFENTYIKKDDSI